MGMRIGFWDCLTASKISTATLLAMVVMALAVYTGGMTGQRSTKIAEQSPLIFTAIDLNANWIGGDSHAVGISGEQQVGYADRRDRQPTAIHALLWRGSAASVVDLNPGGFEETEAHSICGSQQAGWGTGRAAAKGHALLWWGSAARVVDLTPSGMWAQAWATSGEHQAGLGLSLTAGQSHALLWRGSAASVVDLHPSGFNWSKATGVSGGQQVGFGGLPSATRRNEHALLWRGSAASVVDLHPGGFALSFAWGVGGGQQVGTGLPIESPGSRTRLEHVLLWRGSADSVVDLGPGFAAATNGVEQVGSAGGHAVLWRGSAASMMDLHVFLPPIFTVSGASGIDANGNVVGSASPTLGPVPDWHAFLWRRNVPKPVAPQQGVGRCE